MQACGDLGNLEKWTTDRDPVVPVLPCCLPFTLAPTTDRLPTLMLPGKETGRIDAGNETC
jgi:hypothetical protein